MAIEDSVAQDQLRAFVERIERMNEEKAAINSDISEIYREAKGNGFDTKVLKKIIADRSKDANDRMEFDAIYELYAAALGMIATPDFDEPRVQVQARVREATESAPKNTAETQPPQPAGPRPDLKQDASDLTPPEPTGQVAPIQPETVEQSAEPETASASGGHEDAKADLPAHHVQGASEATEAHNLGQAGSTPAPATIYAAPGIIRTEHTPPEPVKWHPYANCFPTVLGDDLAALEADIHTSFGGVREPIVKIGNLILDGRARYGIARSMLIDYPTVQYAGTDPLMDVIAWNIVSRGERLTAKHRKAAATALCKLEPSRTDEILTAFGLETVTA